MHATASRARARSSRGAGIAAIALALTVTACGGDAPPEQAEVTPTAGSPTPSAATASSPTASASASPEPTEASLEDVKAATLLIDAHGVTTEAGQLDAAEALLTQTPSSLGEIAFLAGFSDQSAFSRACKAHTGLTPMAFRSSRA